MSVRRLVAALLLLSVLVSCSDEDSETSETGDPTTPTSSPTPTEPPPPTEPPLAGERSEAGAKAFVEYWIATLNHASASGTTTSLRKIGMEDCQGCSRIADLIDEVYDAGGEIDGDGWEAEELHPSSIDVGEKVQVEAILVVHPQVIHHGDGSAPDRNPGLAEAPATFDLVWTGEGWRLGEIRQGAA